MNQTIEQEEDRTLCPICKDGMKCSSVIGHARLWDVNK